MSMINPFLGLNADDAKKKYRKMCFDTHPDRGGTNESFIQVQKWFNEYCENKNMQTDKEEEKVSYEDSFQSFYDNLDSEMKQSIKYILKTPEFAKYVKYVSIIANHGVFTDILNAFGKTSAAKSASKAENIIKQLLG